MFYSKLVVRMFLFLSFVICGQLLRGLIHEKLREFSRNQPLLSCLYSLRGGIRMSCQFLECTQISASRLPASAKKLISGFIAINKDLNSKNPAAIIRSFINIFVCVLWISVIWWFFFKRMTTVITRPYCTKQTNKQKITKQ